MRARGVARALGQVPHGFDLAATVFTPATRRLGGLGGLGLPMGMEMAPLVPAGLQPQNLQPAPMVTMSVTPPSTSRGFVPPAFPFTSSGIPTAGDRVGDARRSQEPSAPPAGGYLPPPDVHIPDAMEAPPGFVPPALRNGVTVRARGPGAQFTFPFGWPWWIWAMIAGGAATGVYALTRR